ncbi:MAG: FtsQ-type POTRA domain-containing protein [Actinomycetota bacterium]|nr:FtsQ-type POTRA domain-containing protein [Actinomycetota bacterium]
MNVLRAGAAIVAGAVLVVGAQAAYRLAPLEVREVEVVGNSGRRVSPAGIVAISGISKGDRILGISTSRVVRRITAHPWIARARVERILPSKVRVEVVERVPAVVLVTGRGPYLVDSEGVVLQQGNENLVNLLDVPATHLEPGSRVTAREFIHSLRIYRGLPKEVRGTVALIRAPTIDGIRFELFDGSSIFYGAGEKLTEKNTAVLSLLNAPPKGAPRLIDVRVPGRPAFRPL